MARKGRFGNLPGRSPDLSNIITALIEQYEDARDRNILSAWLNGGEFEGKPVTDERLKRWYKTRRSQYTKDDPEYDYWDQQYEQLDFQIGESKMLLAFERGNIKESGAARWYTQNAARFPKNSEAWREAMRNAARFKKAAKEKAKAASSVSKSERYNRAINRVYRTQIAPALEAQRIWEKALKADTVAGREGFMDLDNTAMQTEMRMRRFMNSGEGKRYARQYERATGRPFTYKNFKRLLRSAKQGYTQMAEISRNFGYESYVPGYQDKAREMGAYNVQLNIYTGDINEDYSTLMDDFTREYDAAADAKEREAIRQRYIPRIRKLQRRAINRGDPALGGTIGGWADALDGTLVTDIGELERDGVGVDSGHAPETDVEYKETIVQTSEGGYETVETSELLLDGRSQFERWATEANADAERIAGFESGEWALAQQPDGRIIEVNVENYLKMGAGDTEADALLRAGYVRNEHQLSDGTKVPIFLQMFPVALGRQMGGGSLQINGYMTVDGEFRVHVPGHDGNIVDTSDNPLELATYDDGDPRTDPGQVWDQTLRGPVDILSEPQLTRGQNGEFTYVIDFNPAFIRHATEVAQAEQPTLWAEAETDADKWGITQQFIRARLSESAPLNEDGTGYRNVGVDLTETIEVPNPEYRVSQPPVLVRSSLPHAIQYIAGGEGNYKRMSEEEKGRTMMLARRLTSGDPLDNDLQNIVNQRENQGWTYENNQFRFGGESPMPDTVESRTEITGVDMGNLTPWERTVVEMLDLPTSSITDEMITSAVTYLTQQGVTERGLAGYDEDQRAEAMDAAKTNLNAYIQEQDFLTPDEAAQPGDVRTVEDIQRDRSGGVYEPISPTLREVIRLDAILTDSGTTMDRTGNFAQYMSIDGRRRLAQKGPEARVQIAEETAASMGQAGNTALVYLLTEELDILAASGQHGESEAEFYARSGSLSDDDRFAGLAANTWAAFETRQHGDVRSGTDILQRGLIPTLRAEGWTDDQIEADFPDELTEYRRMETAREAPGLQPAVPGQRGVPLPVQAAQPTPSPLAAGAASSVVASIAHIEQVTAPPQPQTGPNVGQGFGVTPSITGPRRPIKMPTPKMPTDLQQPMPRPTPQQPMPQQPRRAPRPIGLDVPTWEQPDFSGGSLMQSDFTMPTSPQPGQGRQPRSGR